MIRTPPGWSHKLRVASLVVWHMARVTDGVVQSPSLSALTGCNYKKGFATPLLFSAKLESRTSFQNHHLDHRPRPSVMVPSQLGVKNPKYNSISICWENSNQFPLVNMQWIYQTLSVYYCMTGSSADFDLFNMVGLWSAYMSSNWCFRLTCNSFWLPY